MPYDSLESLGVGRHQIRINHGDFDDRVSDLAGIPTIRADDAENLGAHRFCHVERADQINADVLFDVAAPDGEYKHGVIR